jgi:ABC-type Fe3+/spermidine/putrescine transport system ATPase subunit
MSAPARPLRLEGLVKRFGDHAVLDGVSLAVPEGEIVALLGPSGSGKTTLLRLVAGFERADAGRILLGAARVDELPPERRGFGMVFQHYALFPHRSVAGNVAFGLETRGLARATIAARVEASLARVELAGLGGRRISEISGGQQQRVALARALAPEPPVLLLDEPLSNLDPSLRERTRRELAALLRTLGITTLLVTHEQEEAFELGTRVALLHGGRLVQVGTPDELYRAPATRFAAGFIGRASFVPVEVLEVGGGRARVRGEGLPGGELEAEAAELFTAGERAEAMLRPEALELAEPGSAGALPGAVVATRFGGAWSWVTVRGGAGVELEVLSGGVPPAPGAAVAVRRRPGASARIYRREAR